MIDTIIELVKKIIGLLPADPFAEYIDSVSAFFNESLTIKSQDLK